ncbi:MAG TPA: response regulator [Myxococcales bacterium]|nr:response regulator [Myxococcales bacterium]
MKVLLVDDQEDIRKIGRLSLEAVGKHQVMLAANAAEAIHLARSQPDLILMDMMMPGRDGLSALAELRTTPELSAIPVLFMTAKVQRSELEHYLQAGAIGVIQKPFDPMTLPSEIEKIMSALG